MQLGHRDERTAALATRAAERLQLAARRAANHDWPGRVALLTRAVGLLPPEQEARGWALVDLGESLIPLHELTRAEAALGDALEIARAIGNRRVALHAELGLARLEQSSKPEGSGERLRSVAERALLEFEALGDQRGLAHAWERLSEVHHLENRFAGREVALSRALEHARRAADKAMEGSSFLPEARGERGPRSDAGSPKHSRASRRFAPSRRRFPAGRQ